MTLKVIRARRAAALATAAGLFAIAGQAHAAAFYLQEQSVKANGRAWSGEVSERGAQQQWWNPAAVGGITGFQSYGGVTALFPRAHSRNAGTTVVRPARVLPGLGSIPASNVPVGGDPVSDNPVNDGYLPNGGIAIPLGEKFAFGLTATSPYSFTTNYDSDSWARYSADKTRLRTYDIQPSIAFTPLPGVSFGAALNAEYAKATLSNYIPDPLSPLRPDGHQELKGDGWDFGYSLGFQFHNEKVDLGAAYKSSIKHKLKGSLAITGIAAPIGTLVNTSVDGAHAEFSTPWQVTVGGRYHFTPQFTLNAQITRFGWSKFDQISLSNLGTLSDTALPERYKDSFAYSLGGDFAVTDRFTLRAGVQRDLSPVPDGERDPRVPDGNRWSFTGGTSFDLTDRIGIDASVAYTKIASNPIDKPTAALAAPLQTIILTSGELNKAHAWAFGLGAHVNF